MGSKGQSHASSRTVTISCLYLSKGRPRNIRSLYTSNAKVGSRSHCVSFLLASFQSLTSNPWLKRVLLPCFPQIVKVFVHNDSLYSLDCPVIPCRQLSYPDHSAGLHVPCVHVAPPTYRR